jgi:hypothetical protein
MSNAGARSWRKPRWYKRFDKINRKIEQRLTKNMPAEVRLQLKEEELQRFIKRHGSESPRTINVKASLAERLEAVGRIDDARVLWREGVGVARDQLGEDNWYTWSWQISLARNLILSREFNEARDLALHVQRGARKAGQEGLEELRKAEYLLEQIRIFDID